MNVIDQTALDNVRALQRPGTPDLLGRIIDIFFQETPAAVQKIQQAVASGDFETIRTQAHSVKSSAAYLGATAFSAQMAQLESAAREEALPACEEASCDLDANYQLVVSALSQLQDKAA